ncbi:MAG: hypothetical protein ACREMK_08395 [Gemmatimonadota bacterium]
MRAFAALLAAGAGYILLIGTLLSMSTASARPTLELTAELGEATVLAVESPTLVSGCQPAPLS